jgi:hypothetical protein
MITAAVRDPNYAQNSQDCNSRSTSTRSANASLNRRSLEPTRDLPGGAAPVSAIT